MATAPLRMVSLKACAVVTFILFFFFQYFISKKYQEILNKEFLLFFSLIGASLLQVPLRLWMWYSYLVSLPDFLFHLFGIVLGYLFYKSNKIIRVNILAFSFLCCLFLYFKGYDMWLHKLNFETFTGKIENTQNYDFDFQTNSGDTLSLSDFKGKYLLLDCWYTYCGVCYKKMPNVQQLYDNFRQNPEVSIYAMHSFIKNDPEDYITGSEILEKRGFRFPCLSIDIDNPVLKELGVNAYPTVLIFDKESNLIFRGSIENASICIKKLTN